MISFRYHLVSLISVFLAIALGIIIGTTALNGPVLDGLNGQVSDLTGDKRDLEQQTQQLEAQLNQGDAFDQAVAPTVVAGVLAQRTVLLILAGDAVDADVSAAVTELVEAAGATLNGVLSLQPSFSDPQAAQDLQNYVTGEGLPPGIQLPPTDDASVLVASLLGSVLMLPTTGQPVDPTATATVLSGLSTLNVLTQDSTDVAAADFALILTQGPTDDADADARNAALVALASGLDTAGRGVVVAGDATSGDSGLVAAIRADPTATAAVSTVDNTTTAAGQVSAVLALAGQGQGTAGAYGTGDGTEPIPPLTP